MPSSADRERVLDVRPEAAFLAGHRAGAVNIPLELLRARVHELPPRDRSLTVFDTDPERARQAAAQVGTDGRRRVGVAFGSDWLAAGPIRSGPSRDRLWEPHALLVEGLAAAREHWGTLEGRSALDLACGSGRDAVFMALSGLSVEAWDVLPDALRLCDDLAARSGVTVRTRRRDIEHEPAVGAGPFDLITCFNFLHRPLMPAIAAAVRPGGLVVYETFVHPQRELFGRPRRDAHLLRAGELAGYFDGWRVVVFREGLTGPRRFAASLIARKPGGAD